MVTSRTRLTCAPQLCFFLDEIYQAILALGGDTKKDRHGRRCSLGDLVYSVLPAGLEFRVLLQDHTDLFVCCQTSISELFERSIGGLEGKVSSEGGELRGVINRHRARLKIL